MRDKKYIERKVYMHKRKLGETPPQLNTIMNINVRSWCRLRDCTEESLVGIYHMRASPFVGKIPQQLQNNSWNYLTVGNCMNNVNRTVSVKSQNLKLPKCIAILKCAKIGALGSVMVSKVN